MYLLHWHFLVYIINLLLHLYITIRAWLTWAVGQARAGLRRRTRTDDGRRPAASGRRGWTAKIAMSRQGRGLRRRTDGRAGTSHPTAERRDCLCL